ncbi:predicted protein [Naegleria gruberi]|uniref:Predicted protein n=1 Tax=Naegleria gruberi TaxID=5762 RepID=D2VE58_NAEGR|nr:uncharacterized protein NAEGRDRAFT_67162 [Naegleria gruberi]EFC44738.1 predicted protein [Naegleria gruberi]|eukprot:XP_002677482.1 predicted protein [Naegleria gruberi strain NEG-M]
MEMRREFYLNHFVRKEHKIVIIEKLDDLLKAMKSVVKRVGNLDQLKQANDSTVTEKDGKIMLGEKEQDLINEEYKNRALPTSCLNWRYQVQHIEPIMKELEEMGIGFLEICAVILVFFARPEISYTLLKRMLKSDTSLQSNESKVHAYVLLAQSHLFWKGVPRRDIGLSSNDNRPLQYLRSALSLLEKVDKKNYNSTVNHILVWTYINLIQQCCLPGDETRISVEDLEHLMNDFYQILFILDSSELSEFSHMNALCQDGIRFWFAHLQSQLGAFDQFQRVSLLPDHEVVSLVEKMFNEFHSANLPLPKQCLNKFFLHALSESLLMRNNLEGFLRNIRLDESNKRKEEFIIPRAKYALFTLCTCSSMFPQ